MLLIFNQYADIPEKTHVFYDQAFDTLFARHEKLIPLSQVTATVGLAADLTTAEDG